jgi:hypothetical protein
MKDDTVYCDLCGEPLKQHSEPTLHLKFKKVKAEKYWWWYRKVSSIEEVDVCDPCYGLIYKLARKKKHPFRDVFNQYNNMSINDGNLYIARLRALTDEVHSYTKFSKSEQIKHLEVLEQSIVFKIRELKERQKKYGG